MKNIFPVTIIMVTALSAKLFAEDIKMTCKHSFQGNYSGGDGLLKYEHLPTSEDKAYIYGDSGWIEICTDVQTHGKIRVENFSARCSIYLPNWMNQRRKDFIWDFRKKELYSQTLWQILNPTTNEKEWQWMYGIGKVGSKDRKHITVWEADHIDYEKRKCE